MSGAPRTCTLRVTSGPSEGTSVEVQRELVIGRGAADLKIADEELSRRHAAVRLLETGVVVEDLGSLNGTFVDGERIDAPVTLLADATIRVGRSTIEILLPPPAPEPPTEEDTARTRLAKAPPTPPEPQLTRMRPAPGGAQPKPSGPAPATPGSEESSGPSQEPAPIPQPEVTRVHETPAAPPPEPQAPPEPSAPPQEPPPIPQPQVTRVRETPAAPPGAAPPPQPQVTRISPAVPGEASPPAGEAPGADAADPRSGEAPAKAPGALARLLGRILHRGGDGGDGRTDE